MNVTQESWRAIPGYEGSYEVSDHGRVRSLDRTIIRSDGALVRLKGKLKSVAPRGWNRRPQVPLLRDGKQVDRYVHHLVLEAFVGPCPPGMEGCHADDDRMNNHLSNLRWDTRSANILDRKLNGRDAHYLRELTHCKRGSHPLSGDNLMVISGVRRCRKCRNDYQRAWKRRTRQERSL